MANEIKAGEKEKVLAQADIGASKSEKKMSAADFVKRLLKTGALQDVDFFDEKTFRYIKVDLASEKIYPEANVEALEQNLENKEIYDMKLQWIVGQGHTLTIYFKGEE